MEVHPYAGAANELAATLTASGFSVQLADAALRPTERIEPPSGYLFARRA